MGTRFVSALESPVHQNFKDAIVEAGVRDQAKIIIGGAPVTHAFADQIGADGYARGAYEAVQLLDSKKEAWKK